ncbi:MAG: tetratricopeptide repeat protein [Candidatus Acidiferrales bacterium]
MKAQAPLAEATRPRAAISVRELSIPESARRSYDRSRTELLETMDSEAALSHLRKAIADYPDYYEAWYLLGVAYIMQKESGEAEAALRKSMAMSAERFAPPLLALASLYSDARRYGEAEPLAAQALALDDSLWYTHYELARARFRLGRAAEALPSARVVARKRPGYARGRLLLALIQAQLNRYQDALTHLDAYLLLAPNAPDRPHLLRLQAELTRAADAAHTASVATSAP